MIKCPYCGRDIIESERYCFFCEQDLSKTVDKAEKPEVNVNLPNLKIDFKKIKKNLGNLRKNRKIP